MRKMFEPEDYVILDMFSSRSREDTITRLAYAAAYFTKLEFKCRACRIREKLGEWDDAQWDSFYEEELQGLAVIALEAPDFFREHCFTDEEETAAWQKSRKILKYRKKSRQDKKRRGWSR